MKILSKSKDGGPDSKVTMYCLIEIKQLFTITILRFDPGTREAYHNHAFNCISWLLSGHLLEMHKDGNVNFHEPSVIPFTTKRTTFHKVSSTGTSYVLTFRGPWDKTWQEYTDKESTLTWGRKPME